MTKYLMVIVSLVFFISFGSIRVSSAEILSPLDVITVDTTLDSNDEAYQACTSDPDDCSLRGAITKSNSITGGIGTIVLPGEEFELALTGTEENNNAIGDLDIHQPVVIMGAGPSDTIISAGPSKSNGIDRVFHLHNDLSGTVRMSDLTIRWGTISSGSDGGAGILHYAYTSGSLILERVSVEENVITTDRSGGGLLSSGTLKIRDSSFINNSAILGEGGGVYHASDTFTCERTTIAGNTARYGGGLANQNVAVLRNVTISGNSAVNGGGGISQWNDGDLTIYNTTITDNMVTGGSTSGWAIQNVRIFNAYNSILTADGSNRPCSQEMDAGDHNVSSDTSCGTGATVADPLLGALADNGGLTLTHALPIGSPAIDAADNSRCPVADQRGVRRRYDGDSNGSLICDIGAYEYNTGLTLLNIFTPLIVRP
jgi:hypothetical protein